MSNKSEKMQNFKNTLIVFGLIILFIGCFLLAVITPFAITLHDKVSYADSTDGVVEDNIFTVSTFDGLSGSTTLNMQLGTSGWYLSGAGSTTRSFSNNTLSSSAYAVSGVYAQFLTFLQNPSRYAGQTFTFSCYGELLSYDWLLQVWYNDTGVSTTALANTGYNTTSLKSLSFTVPSTITSEGVIRLIVQTRGSVKIDWVKLEEGSSFTGYVPKNYMNYGYTQGYNDGTKDTLEVYNTVRGYTILGSTTQYLNDVVFAGYNYFSSPIPNLPYIIIPNLPVLFSYNNVDYYLVRAVRPTIGTQLTFNENYLYHMFASTAVGCAAVPIGVNIAYTGNKNIYLCKDFTIAGNYNIIVRSSDGLNTIIIDTYTVDAYFSNVPVMDLSKYLSKGVSYNFYLVSKTVAETGSSSYIELDTHNTYFTGLNSLCIITIEDADQIGQSSYEEGRKAGYSAGRQAGYWEGYGDGYSQGELVAPEDGQYTFLGVIGALFDAPIGALSSFLNFELLGFNMRSFFFALISLAFIILVLRIVLGSKL